MNSRQLTMTPDVAFRLMDRLSKIKSVTQFDRPGRPEAGTLAHSFADLEKSFCEVLDVLFPKLLDESLTPEQMNDVLLDIGEELRHILYHIKDPKFFGYLLDTD
jgi:hypothetical protein